MALSVPSRNAGRFTPRVGGGSAFFVRQHARLMKIYEVIFYYSHTEKPEKDTIYLVRAQDFMAAVDEVLTNSSPSHHGGEKIRLAHVVYEVGEDLSSQASTEHPRILRGPYFESAYNCGWRTWKRVFEPSGYTKEWKEVVHAA